MTMQTLIEMILQQYLTIIEDLKNWVAKGLLRRGGGTGVTDGSFISKVLTSGTQLLEIG